MLAQDVRSSVHFTMTLKSHRTRNNTPVLSHNATDEALYLLWSASTISTDHNLDCHKQISQEPAENKLLARRKGVAVTHLAETPGIIPQLSPLVSATK